jgi:hypothetical protein
MPASRSPAFPLRVALAACASFALLGAPADLQAQVSQVQVRKVARHVQTSATDVALRSSGAFQFQAIVEGASVAPTVTGPFNTALLGARHNNGVMVYSASGGSWRWGADGENFTADSKAEVDNLFGSGTYTFTVSGTSVPLALTGDQYPDPPRLTLSGGKWSGGTYVIDPSQPLTITTNAYAGWGSHRNDTICTFLRGKGFVAAEASSIATCPLYVQRASETSNNVMSVTVPANTLQPNEDYTLVTTFTAIVDSRTVAALPGSSNTARYMTTTAVSVKTSSPVFPMTVTSNITPTSASATASIQFRPQDVGTTGSVFVFALAPATLVQGGTGAQAMKVGHAKGASAKAGAPVACVLAQLSQSGQLAAVTPSQLQAYLTGVLSAQGATVTILNNVATVSIAGSTFFVGYGATGSSMISSGINRSAVAIPGSLQCEPGPPQTGWWWNPLEGGRGYSLEVQGNNLFFASFLYDVSGRSTWYVSTGPVSLDGSYYTGDLLSARGGQSLAGAYPGFPALTREGNLTLTFGNSSTGTMVWPGGVVPIQRFDIVAGGRNLDPVPGEPQGGWWWNDEEAGRGFFLEWQGGNLQIAGYMYDDAGNPVWYLTTGALGGTSAARSFSGAWWSFGGGQTLMGPWKPNTQLSNDVAPVTIQFSGPDTAMMTLPGGRTTSLKRNRF